MKQSQKHNYETYFYCTLQKSEVKSPKNDDTTSEDVKTEEIKSI